MILAATRGLLMDVGMDGIYVHDIAERCGISVPTIYNVVGDRNRVVSDAAVEWIDWVALTALMQNSVSNPVLIVLEGLWRSALANLRYTTNAVQSMTRPESPIYEPTRQAGTAFIAKLLADLRAQGRVRPIVAIDRLAWHLIESVHNGVVNWIINPYDAKQFRAEFADGPGLMLLGAMSNLEAKMVELELDRIRSRMLPT